MDKSLIIYYSRKGENYFAGTIKKLDIGNTEIAAKNIKKIIDADMFEIKTIKQYPSDYHKCTDEAMRELRAQERPELINYLDNIDQYNNVFILGPCWWGTYPMGVFTQLEKLNFEGKKVIPVMTHEGSGLGDSIRDLKKICKGANITEGLAIKGSLVSESNDKIEAFISKVI